VFPAVEALPLATEALDEPCLLGHAVPRRPSLAPSSMTRTAGSCSRSPVEARHAARGGVSVAPAGRRDAVARRAIGVTRRTALAQWPSKKTPARPISATLTSPAARRNTTAVSYPPVDSDSWITVSSAYASPSVRGVRRGPSPQPVHDSGSGVRSDSRHREKIAKPEPAEVAEGARVLGDSPGSLQAHARK
jgi:hypothetical protein